MVFYNGGREMYASTSMQSEKPDGDRHHVHHEIKVILGVRFVEAPSNSAVASRATIWFPKLYVWIYI